MQERVRAAILVACSVWTACVKVPTETAVKDFHDARVDEHNKWISDNPGVSKLEKTEQAREIWKAAIPRQGLLKAFEHNFDLLSGITQMESAKAALAEIIKDDEGNEVSWKQDKMNTLNRSEDGLPSVRVMAEGPNNPAFGLR